jgi:methyltransferase-like protein
MGKHFKCNIQTSHKWKDRNKYSWHIPKENWYDYINNRQNRLKERSILRDKEEKEHISESIHQEGI